MTPEEYLDALLSLPTLYDALPSRDGLPLFPAVPDDVRRQAAEMFARHNELAAQRRRSR